MERATGFEPATSTLARWRATNCAKPATQGDMLREVPLDCKGFFAGPRFSRPALLACRREAARTSRLSPRGRPHFSPRTSSAGDSALGARTRRLRSRRTPHSMSESGKTARTRCAHSMRAAMKKAPRRAPERSWRRSPDSNRGSGLCRPVPYHLATSPYEKGRTHPALKLAWSGLRGSNPRPPPWQGGALPTALSPQVRGI